MNQPQRNQIALTRTTALAILALTASPAHAATMSASATAPVVNGLDIANYGAVTGSDKWFYENSGAGAAKGQTFKTGTTPVLLKSISYQVTSSQKAEPTKGYAIRVGTVSGTTFTQIARETATQSFRWNGGEYMTWAFAAPVLLAANTTYGIDVGMTSSTSSWTTGVPYINTTANVYTNGAQYSSGTSGVGTTTIATTSGDRIFHLDLQHPMAPTPDIGATVPADNVTLGWTNFAPTTGTDVWVDVWYGTNPAALTQVVTKGLNLTSTTVNAPGAASYYWRVDSYLNGVSTGSPTQGDVFSFIVFDSDSDGLPDAYELAYTSPPSATAMVPGNDDDSDGLTNLQEYQLGTIPNNPDTDGDTLLDGPELTGVGLRPATDPKKADTDGDGLSDGVETNTGTWVSNTNTGTNPTNWDTDLDSLADGAETNTGTFVSVTNTGTNPLNSDTDADGAGDWFEITASFTSPFIAAEKPSIPYPLPDPDGSTGASDKKVKVYIMSGQSNMLGFGTVSGTGDGTLETMTRRQNKFPNLVDGSGNFIPRQDVRYRGVISGIASGPLAPGQGSNSSWIGPELGFGQIMGWYHDEAVLLLKSSIGNRSLGWDILPPASPSYQYGGYNYAAYGDASLKWTIGSPAPTWTTGGWYAGYEWDRFFTNESEWAHPHAAEINVVDILDNWVAEYAATGKPFVGQDFEIAGFVWWQGDKDRYDMGHATRYEQNLVDLINALRSYYTNRYPGKVVANAPFVLATLGQTAIGDTSNLADKAILDGMLAVDGAAGNYPQFAGNVKTVYAHPLSEGGASNSHYNNRAGTYMLVGDALGRAMVDLESVTITTSGALAAVNTTYGTASGTPSSFTVSGTNMTAGITVTPPAGFEVSQTPGGISGYFTAIIVGSSGTIAPTTVYVRLAATAAAGNYSGNITCTSSGATSQNVATAPSSVSPAALTVTANADGKTYGQTRTYGSGLTAETCVTISGLQNSDAVSTVTLTDTDGGGLATAAAGGTYHLTPSALVFTTGSAANYNITYATDLLTVSQADLTVTANADSKTYGQIKTYGSGSSAYSITAGALQNSDAVSTVTLTDTDGGGLASAAAGGTYHLTPSALVFTTSAAANYAITYVPGALTVNPAALTITANADSKTYGQIKTYGSGSSAYSITAGTLQNSDAVSTVTLTDTDSGGLATAAAGGTYHLTPSALVFTTGSAANYAITYAPGLLTVSYIPAAADAGQTVELGAFHAGTTKTTALTLTNTAPTGAFTETLQTNGFSGTSADFIASGSASGIAGGDSASGSLEVGVGAGLGAGVQVGTTTLALQSYEVPGSGLGTTDLGSQSVTIHATGYQLAATDFNTTSADLGTIHAGGTFQPQSLSIGNTLAAGTFNESLGAQFANASGVNVIGGPATVVAGAIADMSMSVSLADNNPGVKSGTVDVRFSSLEVNGSGLGTTGLPALDKTVTVSGKVFNGTGEWTQTTGSSGSWGTSVSWTDANSVHAAPGTFSGFDDVDAATFSGTGTTATVNLDGTSPSLKTLNLSGATAYTIAMGTGSASLIMKSNTGTANIMSAGTGHTISAPVTLASDLTVTVSNIGDSFTASGAIGDGGNARSLTKSGPGTLILGGSNTYTGNTTVEDGTLVIGSACLSDTSTLTIGSAEFPASVLNLPNAGIDTVGVLVIDGVSQPPGLYDSTNTDGAITGDGKVLIDPYLTFLALISNPADRDPGDDPDADGIPNAVEFVIGGTPVSAGDRALLPTNELVTTDFGNGATAYSKFTYRRVSGPSYIASAAEYATNLTGTWTPAVSEVSGVVVVSTTNGFAAGVDKVEVYIPRALALSGKLFARLRVTVAP